MYPDDNDRFLDAIIEEIDTITGRVYGAATYERLIGADQAVSRRPSRTTIQKAIERAQRARRSPSGGDELHESVDPLPGQDVTLEAAVRAAVAPLHALIAQLYREISTPRDVAVADSRQLPLMQAALEEAQGGIRKLETENAGLQRELGEARAKASILEGTVAKQYAELQRALAASASGADSLARVAKRLEGTEQFLKMQNDAVRLQATAEADALRRQAQQLRERIDHLLLDNDQYRRALAVQRGTPDGK